jgi:phospholipase C
VPLLVVSPFSRGGFVCSDTFDHTSLLRFLETRFGVEVPNLSAWRRSVTWDLTSAFNFAAPASNGVPALPAVSLLDPRVIDSDCVAKASGLVADNIPTNPLTGILGTLSPTNPVPANQGTPAQEPGSPLRPSGLAGCR